MRTLNWIIAAALVSAAASGQAQVSPYAGEASRAIKALSTAEVRGLLAGEGMGFARAAELNGYPGPMHVLELAQPLALTEAQRDATQTLMRSHKDEARALGAALIEAERALDTAFARQQIDASKLTTLVAETARLQAAVRRSHLVTHLAQAQLLTPAQIERYGALRGYRSDGERIDPYSMH